MARRNAVLRLAVGVLAAAVVLIATRADPILSPDSITYLSAADALRSGNGYVDFTGEPLSHFPPVFPVLLAVGGRSLTWATIVGAAVAAAAGALFAHLLLSRVRWAVAAVGSVAFVLSQALVTVESTVWSETPYLVLALATMAVLARSPISPRRCAAAGVVAGLGFLTRYAGAGLVATGLAMVVVATWDRDRRPVLRSSLAYLGPVVALASAWIARNLVATGQPLGPHFEGGAGERADVLLGRVPTSIGRLVVDIDTFGIVTDLAGYAVLFGLAAAVVVTLARRPPAILDVGMAAFALTSVVVPTVSRALTGTHIEARIMSPVLVPTVYFAVVALDRVATRRVLLGAGALVALVWSYQGATAARDLPDRLPASAGYPRQFAPRLYDVVDALPPDAVVLTNNPQRVWWHTDRVPTWFAFTRPQAGNSHFPLEPSETAAAACTGQTYLAWFRGLANTLGLPPTELRPDLAELVELTEVDSVPGGTLYVVEPVERDACP